MIKAKEFNSTSNGLKDMTYLTKVSKILAINAGIQIDGERDSIEISKRVSRSISQQSRYVVNPTEILLIKVNKHLKLSSKSIDIVMSTQDIFYI